MSYHICPSVSNGQALGVKHAVCGPCSTCFTKPDTIVLYPKHGNKVKKPHVKRQGATNASVTVSAITSASSRVTVTVRSGERSVTSDLILDPVPVSMTALSGIKLPGSICQLFSQPEKMATLIDNKLHQIYSFNTTAFYSPLADTRTCPAASLKPGGCGSYCYARQGTYQLINSVLASELRTLWLVHHLKHGNHRYIADTLASGIIRTTLQRRPMVPFFRFHDSGDIINAEHANVVVEAMAMVHGYGLACGTQVRAWLPSHSVKLDAIGNMLADAQRYGLLVRPSYDLVDINDLPDRLPQFAGYSGVVETSRD